MRCRSWVASAFVGAEAAKVQQTQVWRARRRSDSSSSGMQRLRAELSSMKCGAAARFTGCARSVPARLHGIPAWQCRLPPPAVECCLVPCLQIDETFQVFPLPMFLQRPSRGESSAGQRGADRSAQTPREPRLQPESVDPQAAAEAGAAKSPNPSLQRTSCLQLAHGESEHSSSTTASLAHDVAR
jgi:hypothetical protein